MWRQVPCISLHGSFGTANQTECIDSTCIELFAVLHYSSVDLWIRPLVYEGVLGELLLSLESCVCACPGKGFKQTDGIRREREKWFSVLQTCQQYAVLFISFLWTLDSYFSGKSCPLLKPRVWNKENRLWWSMRRTMTGFHLQISYSLDRKCFLLNECYLTKYRHGQKALLTTAGGRPIVQKAALVWWILYSEL